VADFEAWHQAELDRLARQRISARNHRLARDHGGDGRKRHHRDQRPIRKHQEERVLDPFGIAEDQRALPHVIERQRRQHQEQPRSLNRLLAEMPEIGIERLGAGDGQEHRAQRHEADHRRDGS